MYVQYFKSQKYSSWIFLYFLNFWLNHDHSSSAWACNKTEKKSIYYEFQKEIEPLPRTVFSLGPLCVWSALNGCLLKYAISFVSALYAHPSKFCHWSNSMIFLILAILFYGNCWWDSSESSSSQYSVVFSFVSPIFPKLRSEDTRPWGAFFLWNFCSLGVEASGCNPRQFWVLLLSKAFTLNVFHCSGTIETAQLVNSQGEIGLKNNNNNYVTWAQPVTITTQCKDLFSEANISGLFQAVTLQLTWHFTSPEVPWMNSLLRFGILLELGISWNSLSLYMLLEIIPTRQVHMF